VITTEGEDEAYVCLSPKGYEHNSVNAAEILRYINELQLYAEILDSELDAYLDLVREEINRSRENKAK